MQNEHPCGLNIYFLVPLGQRNATLMGIECCAPLRAISYRLVGIRSVNMVTVYARSLRRFTLTGNEWKHPVPVTQTPHSQSSVSNGSFLPETSAGKRRNVHSRLNHRKSKWRFFRSCLHLRASTERTPSWPELTLAGPLWAIGLLHPLAR